MSPPSLFRLKASLQQYDWGKQGKDSLVAQLAPNAVGPSFSLDNDASYAEVWMGTHPNGPTSIFSTPNTSLLDTITSDPNHFLGAAILAKWPSSPAQVPFLFKVLSIAKALPLQAHPDKALAERLHAQDAKEFVDANHKPEIAVAIGEPLTSDGGWGEGVAFTGFVGFRPFDAIRNALRGVPELVQAVGNDDAVNAFLQDPSKESLKAIFSSLIERGAMDPAVIKEQVRALVEKIKSKGGDVLGEEQLARVVLKVDSQYPGDVGVFATTFFMNLVKLKKGEAVYIGADEIHAYLEGDIIECMAVSDNVLNAAFTNQAEAQSQVPTFLSMLTYTARPASHWTLSHGPYQRSKNHLTQVYAPPLEEFVVMGTNLGDGRATEVLGQVDGPTIGIVRSGSVKVTVNSESLELESGGVFYVVPGCAVTVEKTSGGKAQVWWAACAV
ncbi:hypothetical protein EIP91_008911 [Steccherinum ochraceum]|uniref:Mannose-6-phosphate isomerase n=1 Tax=Steccherinum ochraceum TaxID=92696 RepID=A0A4R0RRK0_9APHY|nr:hypothetical protein EIP91_008911 [Steccherinum ochraceum]